MSETCDSHWPATKRELKKRAEAGQPVCQFCGLDVDQDRTGTYRDAVGRALCTRSVGEAATVHKPKVT
jgi:hypothetical protein